MLVELEISVDEYHAASRYGKGDVKRGIRTLVQEELKRQKSYDCTDNTELFIKKKLEVTEDDKDVISLKDLYGFYSHFVLTEGIDKRKDGKHKFRMRIERLNVDYGVFNGNIRGFRFLKVVEDQIEDDDEEWEL